jgi:hypothetical protein
MDTKTRGGARAGTSLYFACLLTFQKESESIVAASRTDLGLEEICLGRSPKPTID